MEKGRRQGMTEERWEANRERWWGEGRQTAKGGREKGRRQGRMEGNGTETGKDRMEKGG